MTRCTRNAKVATIIEIVAISRDADLKVANRRHPAEAFVARVNMAGATMPYGTKND